MASGRSHATRLYLIAMILLLSISFFFLFFLIVFFFSFLVFTFLLPLLLNSIFLLRLLSIYFSSSCYGFSTCLGGLLLLWQCSQSPWLNHAFPA